jgi:transposase
MRDLVRMIDDATRWSWGRGRFVKSDSRPQKMEETSFTRGHHHFTLVNDLDGGRVLFVGEHRTAETLDEFWSSLTAEQIEAVAMDMWDRR